MPAKPADNPDHFAVLRRMKAERDAHIDGMNNSDKPWKVDKEERAVAEAESAALAWVLNELDPALKDLRAETRELAMRAKIMQSKEPTDG